MKRSKSDPLDSVGYRSRKMVLSVDLPDQFYEYLGMRCIHKEEKRFYNPLVVFEKRDPSPWIYPNGVYCGNSRIIFDKSVGEFCLSDQAAGGVSR